MLLFAAVPIRAGLNPRLVTVDNSNVQTPEGSYVSNTGTYTLGPDDTFSHLSASVGDIVDTGGSWTWTYTPPDGPDGYPLSVTITLHVLVPGGAEETASSSFDLQVDNVAPELDLSGTGGQSAYEGESVLFTLGTIVDPGAESFGILIQWGDGESELGTFGGFPEGGGATIDSLSHTYAQDGDYAVTITVTDGDGGSDSDMFNVTVYNKDPDLDISAAVGQVAVEGSGQEFSLGTFSDAGVTDNWTASVDWGDGSSDSLGSVYSGTPLSAMHTYADNGDYTVTVNVYDDGGGSTMQQFNLVVENTAPILSIAGNQKTDEGSSTAKSPVGFDLGSFSDVAGDGPWIIDVNWGDGISDSTTGDPGTSLMLPHVYSQDGVYTVEVKVTDKDGDFDTGTFEMTVDNVPPAIDITGTSGQISLEGDLTFFNLGIFQDPGADNWSGSVDLGDGSTDSLDFTMPGVGLEMSHSYADNGIYNVRVRIEDSSGGADEQFFYVYANNAPPVLSIAGNQKADEGALEPKALAGFDLGTFTDAGIYDGPWDIHVNWGDGADESTTGDGIAPNTLPHTYANNGVYTVSVTVVDKDGDSDTGTFEVTVDNVAPVVSAPSDQTAVQNEYASFDLGSFTDPGADSPWSVTVSWGDGHSDTFSMASAGGLDPANHTYSGSGIFTATVVVDDGEASGTNTFQVTVTRPPTLVVEAPVGDTVYSYDVAALGTVIVGATNDVLFTVRNTGENNLTGISVALTGDGGGSFSLLTSPPATLAPGARATFTVRCIPSIAGPLNGSVTIDSNDPNDPSYPFDLVAEAVDETSDFLYAMVRGTTVGTGEVPLPATWRGRTLESGQELTLVYQFDNRAVTSEVTPEGTASRGLGIASVMVQLGTQKPVFISRAEMEGASGNVLEVVDGDSEDNLYAFWTTPSERVGMGLSFAAERFGASTLIPFFGTTPEQVVSGDLSSSGMIFNVPGSFDFAAAVTTTVSDVRFSYSPIFLNGQVAWADDVSGDFDDGSSWAGGNPPTASEDAVFHDFGPLESPYGVTLPVGVSTLARSLQILGGAGQSFVLSASSGNGEAIFDGGESYIFNSFAQFYQEDPTLDQKFNFSGLTVGGGVLESAVNEIPGSLAVFFAPVSVLGSEGLKILPGGYFVSMTNTALVDASVSYQGLMILENFVVASSLTSSGRVSVASGAFFGAVTNNGEFSVGSEIMPNYISEVTFLGENAKYVQTSGGKLVVDIEGPVRGVDYDSIRGLSFISGGYPSAELDGTIELFGYDCGCGGGGGWFLEGDEFVIMSGFFGGITGTFSTINMPSGWTVEYRDTDDDTVPDSVVVIAGPPPAAPAIGILDESGHSIADSSTVDFGDVVFPGSLSRTITFTITNSGTVNLNVGGISVTGLESGDFTVDTTSLVTPVPPGGSTTFSITFQPLGTMYRDADIEIQNDDPFLGPFLFFVEGYGNSAPVAVADSVTRVSGRSLKVPASALLGNDTDDDGDTLSVLAGSTVSANGVTVRFDGAWIYYDATSASPNTTDTFDYTVDDGYGGTGVGTVTVTVTTPPVAGPSYNLVSASTAGPDNRNITVTFQGAPRRNYRVYAQSTLGSSWTLLDGGTPVTSGNDGRFSVLDSNVFNSVTRYYRTEIVP
jgi:hypothetical protein